MLHIKNQKKSDEIDLIELVRVLWNKKWWIILSTLICTLFSTVYIVISKEQWTSKADVISPRVTDISSYLSLRKEYGRILGNELDLEEISNKLFSTFEGLVYSVDQREKFLLNSNVYKNLANGKTELDKQKILKVLSLKHFSMSRLDPKKDYGTGVRIGFYAENAELAQNTLKDFISTASQNALALELADFLFIVNEKIYDLKFELSEMKKNTEVNRDIIYYKIEEKQIEERLKKLSLLLNKINDVKANSFSYLNSPYYPLVRDKPNKIIILGIGAIIGLFLSCLVVFMLDIFRNKSSN